MAKFYEPKKLATTVGRIVSNPIGSVSKLVHNPADMLVGDNIRQTGFYKNIVRPVAKVGAGALGGFVASGFNPLGAVAGGLASAVGGGLTNNPFRPLPNLVGPAALGGALGMAPGINSNTFNLPTDISNPLSGIGDILKTPGINPAAGGTGSDSILSSVLGEGGGTSLKDLIGLGLQTFGGQKPVPGQITTGQRGQAVARMQQLTDPNVIRQRLASLRTDSNIQRMLKGIRKEITEQTRNEYLSTYASHLSATGGWGSSQQQQIEQQMAADLSERMARAEQDFLLNELSKELNTNIGALQQQLGQQPMQQDTRLTSLGKLLAAL